MRAKLANRTERLSAHSTLITLHDGHANKLLMFFFASVLVIAVDVFNS